MAVRAGAFLTGNEATVGPVAKVSEGMKPNVESSDGYGLLAVV